MVPGSLRVRLGGLGGDGDVGAVARGAQRDGQADAAAGAGDEQGLAAKAHGFTPLVSDPDPALIGRHLTHLREVGRALLGEGREGLLGLRRLQLRGEVLALLGHLGRDRRPASRISALVWRHRGRRACGTASAAARARARSSAAGHRGVGDAPGRGGPAVDRLAQHEHREGPRVADPGRQQQREAASGTSARLTNGVVSCASSATNTRSQCSSMVTPTPTAWPCTAATSGIFARPSAISSGLPPSRAWLAVSSRRR